MPRRVFLAFVQEDLDLVNLFRGQAKNKNSELEFSDYSVKAPFNSTDGDYIRSQIRPRIRAASVTVCLIGGTTWTSGWVGWELRTSIEEGNRLVGIRLHSNSQLDWSPKDFIGGTIVDWDIDAIVRAIG